MKANALELSATVNKAIAVFSILFLFSLYSMSSWAHDLSVANGQFIKNVEGVALAPFLYLGAKHMFTGYDHVLFLLGVIFFLYRPRDIFFYVTLFTIGHSITLLMGVLMSWQVSAHLVDAIIGLSIVYKALDNIQAFEKLFNVSPNTGYAVFVFGLFHGLGLATKLQEHVVPGEGLLSNLISFNIGVEIGQLFALMIILAALTIWRRLPNFHTQSFNINIMLMVFGFIFFGHHMAALLIIGS